MRLFASLFLAVVFLPVGCQSASRREMDSLQGTWTVVSLERMGVAQEFKAEANQPSIVFTGTIAHLRLPGGVTQEGEFSVDTSKSPHTIDIVPFKSTATLKTPLRGVFERKGDELRICLAESEEEAKRPKELASAKENRNLLLFVCRRNTD